jgi:hypothetical protein
MKSARKKFTMDELRPPFVRASAGKTSHGVRPVLWLALLLALPCGLTLAQSQQSGTGQLSDHPLRSVNGNVDQSLDGDVGDPVYQQRQLRQLNAALHKSMVSDTNKLLKLVTELNAEISSTNPASLTPEQLRKVAAIEKLARSVRDEMRTSMQGTATIMDAPPDVPRLPH